MEKLRQIIESLLFVSDGPLSVDKIRQVLPEEISAKEIRQALSELMLEYELRNGGFKLREVAGAYQFRSNPIYRDWVAQLLQPNPARLSKAALETLAIIAYHQPIIRADIEHIRGVESGGVIRVLMERKLIRVLGRKDIPGRPLIYATTSQFLELFGLKDLKELPTLKEIEEFGRQNEGTVNPLSPASGTDSEPKEQDLSSDIEIESEAAADEDRSMAPDESSAADESADADPAVTDLPASTRRPESGDMPEPTPIPETADDEEDPQPLQRMVPDLDGEPSHLESIEKNNT